MFEKNLLHYRVRSRQEELDVETLLNDPEAVYRYPVIYAYRQLDSGYYMLLRIVYFGMDYGYYSHTGSSRCGSNYFAHLLLFKEKPPRAIFSLLAENGRYREDVFLPSDYRIYPNNREMERLLTGEPFDLQPKTMTIDTVERATEIPPYPMMGELIVALHAYYLQRKSGLETGALFFRRLLLKYEPEKTGELLYFLTTALPEKLTGELSFYTHAVGDAPDRFDLVVINQPEAGRFDESQHFTVDAFTKNTYGLPDNPFYTLLKAYCREGNLGKVRALLDEMLRLPWKEDTDFDFEVTVYLLSHDPDLLDRERLTTAFFSKLCTVLFPHGIQTKLWQTIEDEVADRLTAPDNPELVREGLEWVARLKEAQVLDRVKFRRELRYDFTRHVIGRPGFLPALLAGSYREELEMLFLPEAIEPDDRKGLMAFLTETARAEDWLFFGRAGITRRWIETDFELFTGCLLNSALLPEERERVVLALYDTLGLKRKYLAYIVENKQDYGLKDLIFRFAAEVGETVNVIPSLLALYREAPVESERYTGLIAAVCGLEKDAEGAFCFSSAGQFCRYVEYLYNLSPETAACLPLAEFTPGIKAYVARIVGEKPEIGLDFLPNVETVFDPELAVWLRRLRLALLVGERKGLAKVASSSASLVEVLPDVLDKEWMFIIVRRFPEIFPQAFLRWLPVCADPVGRVAELISYIGIGNGDTDGQRLYPAMIAAIARCGKKYKSEEKKELCAALVNDLGWGKSARAAYCESEKADETVVRIVQELEENLFGRLFKAVKKSWFK